MKKILSFVKSFMKIVTSLILSIILFVYTVYLLISKKIKERNIEDPNDKSIIDLDGRIKFAREQAFNFLKLNYNKKTFEELIEKI